MPSQLRDNFYQSSAYLRKSQSVFCLQKGISRDRGGDCSITIQDIVGWCDQIGDLLDFGQLFKAFGIN